MTRPPFVANKPNAQPRIYLEEWRAVMNMTQTELAKRVGVSKSEVSRLEGGKRKATIAWLEKFSEALGIRREQLMSPPGVTVLARETVMPVGGSHQAEAVGVVRQGVGEFGMSVGGPFTLVEVSDDTMIETFRPGDLVIVDTSKDDAGAGLFAVGEGKQTVVRRLQLSGGKAFISCDNPSYRGIEVPVEDVKVVGRVVGRVSRV